MKSKRCADEQIVGVRKEAEAGAKTRSCAAKCGISEHTFYNLKAKYVGMTVSDARWLKELETKDAKLTMLLAEAEFEKAAMKDQLHRKW